MFKKFDLVSVLTKAFIRLYNFAGLSKFLLLMSRRQHLNRN